MRPGRSARGLRAERLSPEAGGDGRRCGRPVEPASRPPADSGPAGGNPRAPEGSPRSRAKPGPIRPGLPEWGPSR